MEVIPMLLMPLHLGYVHDILIYSVWSSTEVMEWHIELTPSDTSACMLVHMHTNYRIIWDPTTSENYWKAANIYFLLFFICACVFLSSENYVYWFLFGSYLQVLWTFFHFLLNSCFECHFYPISSIKHYMYLKWAKYFRFLPMRSHYRHQDPFWHELFTVILHL